MKPASSWTAAEGASVVSRIAALPDSIRPFAGVVLNTGPAFSTEFKEALETLEAGNVPVFVEIAGASPSFLVAPDRLDRLFKKHTGVVGVVAAGLRFDHYDVSPGVNPYSTPPNVRWAMDAIDVAARYGRRFVLELDGVNTARLMANAECRVLLEKIRSAGQHVAPVARLSDSQAIPGIMSAMGLWLEGSVDAWGITATDAWFAQAPFVSPGVFGANDDAAMPASFYRAMILNGAMTGATICIVEPASAMWFAEDPQPWREAVKPTLEDVVRLGLIPRRAFVERKAQIALQLLSADSSAQFHLNLRDLDSTLDEGLLLHGAYGLELPGLVPELVPNSGRHYWVPVLTPSAPEEVTNRFARVVRAGSMMTAEDWTDLLDRVYQPDGAGTAFISRVGRGVFVMHTRENRYEQQTFRLPRLPSPVYGTSGERTNDGLRISWPFREDDFAYRVYKQAEGVSAFELVADVSDKRFWIDVNVAPGEAAVYAVTAFTDEGTPYEGTVNYGDYLVFSTVESRVEEVIVFEGESNLATVRRVNNRVDDRPLAQTWWPGGEPPPADHQAVADEITGRLLDWSKAFNNEDLGMVMDLYTTDYVDPQGWRHQYARRAYQWFFERYALCRLHTQVRSWDFSKITNGEVSVRVFVRGTGVAMTDSAGTTADVRVRFPRTRDQETVLQFQNIEGAWRIARTDPALPNMKELLSFSLAPGIGYMPGSDVVSK
jgi:ketosteroid isomerase-like protein